MRAIPSIAPLWSALTSRQTALGTGGELARRFREDIGPFAAASDSSPEAIAALAALAHADDDMSLLEVAPPAPPRSVALKLNALGVQMTTRGFSADGRVFPSSRSPTRTRVR